MYIFFIPIPMGHLRVISLYLLWSECLCPLTPNSYVEILTPVVIRVGDWAFGRSLG